MTSSLSYLLQELGLNDPMNAKNSALGAAPWSPLSSPWGQQEAWEADSWILLLSLGARMTLAGSCLSLGLNFPVNQ